MPTVGPNLPSAALSHASLPAGSTVAWTNTAGAAGATSFGDGNAAAASGLSVGKISRLLVLTGFGFALPSTARVDGIQVEVRLKATVASLIYDHTVQVVNGGVLVGDNHARASTTKWPTAYTVISYGGTADDWGAGLLYSDVNSTGFGVAIAAKNDGSTASTAGVDSARITVTYTDVSGGGGSVAAGSVSVTATVRMPTVGSGFTVTTLGGTGYERQTIRDNANATTFVGLDKDASGNVVTQFTEALSASDYRVTTMRSTNPTATTPTWTQYRQDTQPFLKRLPYPTTGTPLASGSSLATAISNAAAGDTITLAAGGTYTLTGTTTMPSNKPGLKIVGPATGTLPTITGNFQFRMYGDDQMVRRVKFDQGWVAGKNIEVCGRRQSIIDCDLTNNFMSGGPGTTAGWSSMVLTTNTGTNGVVEDFLAYGNFFHQIGSAIDANDNHCHAFYLSDLNGGLFHSNRFYQVHAGYCFHLYPNSKNVEVTQNLMESGLFAVTWQDSANQTTNNKIHHNAWHSTFTALNRSVVGGNTGATQGNVYDQNAGITTNTTYGGADGIDSDATVTNNLTADPTFASPSTGDFTIGNATVKAHVSQVTDEQRSAIFPQPFAIASAGDGRWLRRVNQEDLPGSRYGTAVLDWILDSDKSTGTWTAATGSDRFFGSDPAQKTVQVSRIRRRSDGRMIAFGEQAPWAAGTRPASGATRISGWRPFVALSDVNGANWVEVLTKLPGPKVVAAGVTPTTGQISNGLGYTLPGDTTVPLWYPNEPDGVELPNGDWLMIWRSGTIPYTDGDTAATARSSQYVQVTLKKTVGSDTYFFATDTKRATFNQQATSVAKPIHPELVRDPTTGAILFISRDPEGAWYSLNDGGSWAKLSFTSPTATFVSDYYPRSTILADGRVFVAGHRGVDEAYGTSDTAVRFDRFALSSASTGGTGGGTGGGGSIPTGAFVSPLGDDTTGDGSATKPWRTIRKAMLSVGGTGATIYMRGGPNASSRLVHGAVDLRDVNNSSLTSVKPYPGEYVAVGPVRFGGTSGSSYIEFKGDRDLGNMALQGPFGRSVDQTIYVHGWYVDGPSHDIYADGFRVEGTDNYNCFWLQATGGHDFAIRNCVCLNSAYIESVYGTQVNSGGPALMVLTPRGAATYNVKFERNFAQWLEGWDFIQLSTGSTTTTNRHRNIWIQDNETDHVFQGQALFSHSDGTQVIGYSGPLRDGQPNDPEQPDYNPALPIDVGVVIRRNKFHHGGRVLVQATGRTPVGVSGSIPADGEHDSIILDSNLMYQSRGAGEGAPSPDTPAYDFGIKLHANCPNFRVMYNTILSYPLTGTSTGGNQGIVIGGHTSDDPVTTDRGSINGILVGNITDYINTINSGGTVVSFRTGGQGWNTYRNKNTIYAPGTGDIQGTVVFQDPANNDFSLRPTSNPNGVGNGGSTWIPLVDLGGVRRPRTSPNRGALQASSITLTDARPNPVAVTVTVPQPTVGAGVSATTVRPALATVTTFVYPPEVGAPAPEENTLDGYQALVIDPNADAFVLMRPNPLQDESPGSVILLSHKFNAPVSTRLDASSLETEGSVAVTEHTENATIELTFDVREGTQVDLRSKLTAIEAKIAKLQYERDQYGKTGEVQWRTPSGQKITWDVVGVDAYTVDLDDRFYVGKLATISLTLAVRPFGRGEEFTYDVASTSETALVMDLNGIPGHVPAFGSLRIGSDAPGVVHWGLEKGPIKGSLLYYLADGVAPAGGGVPTSVAGAATGRASVATFSPGGFKEIVAVHDPDSPISDSISLPHVGRYRALLRASTTSTNGLVWAQWWPSYTRNENGSVLTPQTKLLAPLVGTTYRWVIVDLGYVEANAELGGGWAIKFWGYNNVVGATHTFALDSLLLVPTDYWGQITTFAPDLEGNDGGSAFEVNEREAVVRDALANPFDPASLTYKAHPQEYRGDYLRVPPGSSRLVVTSSVGTPGGIGPNIYRDDPIKSPSASLKITPRYITFPEEVDTTGIFADRSSIASTQNLLG